MTGSRWASRLGAATLLMFLVFAGGATVASATPDTGGPTVREKVGHAVGVPAAVAVADAMGSPLPPSDACTVTVDGEKIHGRMLGSSWCCLNKGTTQEQCYNCDHYVCRGGWHVTGLPTDAPEFESM